MKRLLCWGIFTGLISFTSMSSVHAGLTLHFEFNGDATDSTGNGNHGTVVGSPVYASGSPLGNSIYFDNPTGSSSATQVVDLPNNFSLLGNGSFSVAILMKTLDTSQQNGRLFGNTFVDSGLGIGYNRAATANAGLFVRDTNSSVGFFDLASGPEGFVADGSWHWLGMSVDRTNNMAYGFIDQTIVSQSIAGLGAISLDDMRIGGLTVPGLGGDGFGSRLTWVDDFRLYDSALTPDEIRGLPLTGVPQRIGTVSTFLGLPMTSSNTYFATSNGG